MGQGTTKGHTISAVVLIPAYNAASTIAETLRSLQANPELREIDAIIVLDDASQDTTIETAKAAWSSAIPLCVWSNETNTGERITVNNGLARLPLGIEWAFLLHADDVVKSNWIELYLKAISGCGKQIATICSSYDNWYADSGRNIPGEEHPDKPGIVIEGTRETVRGTLDRGCWWHISGCAIRTAHFREVGNFEPNLPQTGDWEWLLRCLVRGYSVLYLPRSTMLYRQHARSVSSNSFRRALDVRERLHIFTMYYNQGYLSWIEFRRKLRALMYQLSRRTVVRMVRRDLVGTRHHMELLVVIAAKYGFHSIRSRI
jgi:glycosyltransferase involved in cell wall biosynthesis